MPSALASINPRVISLDPRYLMPGIIGLQGINQSADRLTLPTYECFYTENFEPVIDAWTNYKSGVNKINSSAPIVGKVQGIIGYGDYLFKIINGNFYKVDIAAGTVTTPTGGASAFDSSAVKVRALLARGSSKDKIYLCDGVNSPRVYDTTTDSVTPLALGGSYTAPRAVYGWRNRVLWIFNSDSDDKHKVLASAELDGDLYNVSGTAEPDAFDFEVFPGDGGYVVALGNIQFSGGGVQTDALIACKSGQAYMAEDIIIDSGTRTIVFKSNGVDIAAVSPDANVQFANDFWITTSTGIKGYFSVLQGSGGVAALDNSPVSRLNPLFRKAAENQNFERAFALNHAAKNKIRFFVTKDKSSNANMNGFSYPEIPNDYAICYGYDVLPKWRGNPKGEAFYARGGAGFAFSCGCIHNNTMYLGDYFGDIYEFDNENCGDDYVIAPGGTDQIVYSEWCTPYMRFDQPFEAYKHILEITLHGRSSEQVQYNFDFTLLTDKAPYKIDLPTLTVDSSVESGSAGIYGSGVYGTAIYGGTGGLPNQISIKPPGWANAFGIRNWVASKRPVDGSYKSNYVWINGVSGRVEIGASR